MEQLERKKETQLLADQELAAIKPIKQSQPTNKLTRADIEAHVTQQQQQQLAAGVGADGKARSVSDVTELPLEENINRLVVDGEEARTVDAAIQLLYVH